MITIAKNILILLTPDISMAVFAQHNNHLTLLSRKLTPKLMGWTGLHSALSQSQIHADSMFDFGTDSEGSSYEGSVPVSANHEGFEASLHNDRSTDESMDTSNSLSRGRDLGTLILKQRMNLMMISMRQLDSYSFSHIVYRLSERAIICLLSFLKSMFALVGRMLDNHLLLDVAQTLPKSFYGLHKSFKCEDGLMFVYSLPKTWANLQLVLLHCTAD